MNFVPLIAAEWSSPAARRAHNPKVTGSNPVSAIVCMYAHVDCEGTVSMGYYFCYMIFYNCFCIIFKVFQEFLNDASSFFLAYMGFYRGFSNSDIFQFAFSSSRWVLLLFALRGIDIAHNARYLIIGLDILKR